MRFFLFFLLTISSLFAQTRSIVNVGAAPNDGTGDSARTAFIKVNTNFYTLWQSAYTNGLPVLGGTNELARHLNIKGRTNTLRVEFDSLESFEASGLDLNFSGFNTSYLDAGELTLRAQTNLFLIPPSVYGTTATAGDVMMLTDANTGESDFASPSTLRFDGAQPELTVDALSDVIALTPLAGRVVATKGYWTPGDGGHGVYRWTNALPSGVVTNRGTWFAGSSGFWGLVYDGSVNVRQFGAKGDGVTDDAAAINSALWSSQGMTVIFPQGSYQVAPWTGMPTYTGFLGANIAQYGFVLSATNVTIKGAGIGNATITLDRGGNTVSAGLIKLIGNIDLSGISFISPFTANAINIAGVSITQSEFDTTARVANCYIEGGYHALSLVDYIYDAEIRDNVIISKRSSGDGSGTYGGSYGIATVDPYAFENVVIANNTILNDLACCTGADAVLINIDNVTSRHANQTPWLRIKNITVSGNRIEDFTGSVSASAQGGIDIAGPAHGVNIAGNKIVNTKNAIWFEWLVDRVELPRTNTVSGVISGNDIEATHRGISVDLMTTDGSRERASYTHTNMLGRSVVVSDNVVRMSPDSFNGFQWGVSGSGDLLIANNYIVGKESSDLDAFNLGSTFYSVGVFPRGGNVAIENNTIKAWEVGVLFPTLTNSFGDIAVTGNILSGNAASYRYDGVDQYRPTLAIGNNKHVNAHSLFKSTGADMILSAFNESIAGESSVDRVYFRNGSFGGYGVERVAGFSSQVTASGTGWQYYKNLGVFAGQQVYQESSTPRRASSNGNRVADNTFMATNVVRWQFSMTAGDRYITAISETNFPGFFGNGTFIQLFDPSTATTHFGTNAFIVAKDQARNRFYLSQPAPATASGWLTFPVITYGGGTTVDGGLTVATGGLVVSAGNAEIRNDVGAVMALNPTDAAAATSFQWQHASVRDWQLTTLGSTRQLSLYDTNNAERIRWTVERSLTVFDPLTVTTTIGGILFPRLTTAQRDAIAAPTDGLVIYNTTDNKLQVRAAGVWVNLH